VNVTSSDYSVEYNYAPMFSRIAGNTDPVRQDLLAQDSFNNLVFDAGNPFGHPLFGFGLRIDAGAVRGVNRNVQLQTKADVPTDHGYVSMVRTVIDGQGRYTGPKSLDASPHVVNLTYVTKYVPSSLKAYGAMIPSAPMRFYESSQYIFNPFRPSNCVTVGATIKLWSRGPATFAKFYSFSSLDFDLEAPGFWGRQPLVLQTTSSAGPAIVCTPVANDYFDVSANPLAGIYDQSPKNSVAGYEGLVDEASVFWSVTDGVKTQKEQWLTLRNTDNFTAYDTFKAYDATAPPAPTGVTLGQMLVPIGKLGDVDDLMRIEFMFYAPNNWDFVPQGAPVTPPIPTNKIDQPMIVNVRETLTMALFYAKLDAAYSSLFGVAMDNTTLVTHAEVVPLFEAAMTSWITDISASNAFQYRSSPASDPPVAPVYTAFDAPSFSATWDSMTNRPTFTVTSNSTLVTIGVFRLVVAQPLNHWLGLRGVAPPMYKVEGALSTQNLYNSADLHSYSYHYQYIGQATPSYAPTWPPLL
jgi:hypothetical protein